MRELLIWAAAIVLIIASITITWNTTAYRDVDNLKKEAPSFIKERGYLITSFDGYTGSYGSGGTVWYQARDSRGYLYTMGISDWRGELQFYNLKCLNAVANK